MNSSGSSLIPGARKVNDVNDSQSDASDRTPSSGDREVPRRGDRAGGQPRRDNSSFGERRGKRYDGSQARATGEGTRSGTETRSGDRVRSGDPGRGEGRKPHGDGPRSHGGARQGPGARSGDARRGRVEGRPAGTRPGQDERRATRVEEPALPDDIEASDLDMEVRRDLRGLDKANADMVARHLLAAMDLVEDDPGRALAHGRAAKSRAGRIGVVRETLGVLAYRAGEWAEALGELRAARRISGGPGLLAMMADCERGLGRPERAIELARGDESREVSGEELAELRIVEAGARVDMDQLEAALVTLKDAGVDAGATGEEAARLNYAYADILLAAGRKAEAREWFGHAVSADVDQLTDAESRLAELEV